MRGDGDSEARAVVGKLLAERTCIRSLALLWVLVWLTGVPPAGVFGSLGQVALGTLLLTAQYRWEYLARVTAHTYSEAVSRPKAR